MELVELQPLFDTYYRKLSKIDLRFKRYGGVDEGGTIEPAAREYNGMWDEE